MTDFNVRAYLRELGIPSLPTSAELTDQLWGLDLLCERCPVENPEWMELRRKTRILLKLALLAEREDTRDESMG